MAALLAAGGDFADGVIAYERLPGIPLIMRQKILQVPFARCRCGIITTCISIIYLDGPFFA
jgi:hypothetical protein